MAMKSIFFNEVFLQNCRMQTCWNKLRRIQRMQDEGKNPTSFNRYWTGGANPAPNVQVKLVEESGVKRDNQFVSDP